MHVSFLITDITTRGGVERTTAILANKLVDAGYDISIYSLFHQNAKPTFELLPSVTIQYLCDIEYDIKKGFFARCYAVLKAFMSLLKNKGGVATCDLLICQCFLPALLAFFVGLHQKSVVADHFKYALYSQPIRFCRDFVYARFKAIVTLTEIDRLKYSKVSKKVVCIPNIAEPSPVGLSDLSNKRIIAVGRLHPQKGFDLLIEAVKNVLPKFPEWRLDIFGEGEMHDELQTLITASNLQDQVNIRPFSNQIYGEMKNSSIYVLSSRYEGFPMVLLEAMSTALPIVAFKCPEGPEEMLADDSGVLVELADTKAMGIALTKLMDSHTERLRLSKKAQERVALYSSRNIVKKWVELFEC